MKDSRKLMELKRRIAEHLKDVEIENNLEDDENDNVLDETLNKICDRVEDYEDYDDYDDDLDTFDKENENKDILKDLEVGDIVRIVYEGGEKTGKLKKIGVNYVQVSSENSLWCKIKIQGIKLVELIRRVYVSYSIPFERPTTNTSKLIALLKDQLEDILNLEYTDYSKRIYTNAEVVSYDRFTFTVKDYYTNKLIVCRKNNAEAKSRSDFRTEKILGKRVHWCGALEEGTCSNTLFEMTYGDLVAQLPRKLVKSSNKSKTLLRTLILYLRDTLATPKAKLELNNFHEMAEFFYGPLGIDDYEN